MENVGLLHTADGNVNGTVAIEKTVWRFPKQLKIELPYDSAIPSLVILPKELEAGSQGDFCTPCS